MYDNGQAFKLVILLERWKLFNENVELKFLPLSERFFFFPKVKFELSWNLIFHKKANFYTFQFLQIKASDKKNIFS